MSDYKDFEETPINSNNESKRLPVIFCLDVSPSMHNNGRILQLNLALNGFIEELQSDIRTKKAAEIAIVTFSSGAEVLQDFQEAGKMAPQHISAKEHGATYMGTGILCALDIIRRRCEKYKKGGLSYFLPYLVVITDGNPQYEDPSIMQKAIDVVNAASKAKVADDVVLTFPIGVGNAVTFEHLQKLADGFLGKPIIYNDATEFSDLFQVISRSIGRSIHLGQNVEEQKKDVKNAWLDKLKDVRRKQALTTS